MHTNDNNISITAIENSNYGYYSKVLRVERAGQLFDYNTGWLWFHAFQFGSLRFCYNHIKRYDWTNALTNAIVIDFIINSF